MASGRFLDYLSSHPLHMKTNLVANFIHRVREFSTNLSPTAINKIIDEQLKINHYPPNLRHRLYNRQQRTRIARTETQFIYKPMTHISYLTQRIQHTLKNDLPNVILAQRSEHKIKSLFNNMKDKIPKTMQYNIIYKIPCECSLSYVGLTSTYLKKRLANHKSNIKQLDELLNAADNNSPTWKIKLEQQKEKTALLYHCIEQAHRFDLERTTVIDKHRHKAALPILEMCHIYSNNTVNKRTDTECMNSTYAGILHKLKMLNDNHHSEQIGRAHV